MLIATSWDDGLENDRRLLAILEKYNVRSSFALSPSRYQDAPVPNDVRDKDAYGMLIAKSDLRLYRSHDICSHTAAHREQPLLTEEQNRFDIYQGKRQLEDFFERPVPGIVWPYGYNTPATVRIARQLGHSYGRTTPSPRRRWNYQRWNVVPWSWRTSLEDLLKCNFRCMALSGHTYELHTEADWEIVERFYREATQDSRCRLVTLTELVQSL